MISVLKQLLSLWRGGGEIPGSSLVFPTKLYAPRNKDSVLPVAKYVHPKCAFGNQENDHCETDRVRMLFINWLPYTSALKAEFNSCERSEQSRGLAVVLQGLSFRWYVLGRRTGHVNTSFHWGWLTSNISSVLNLYCICVCLHPFALPIYLVPGFHELFPYIYVG